MRCLKASLVLFVFCLGAARGFANTIPITGSFQYDPLGTMSSNVSGPGFSLATSGLEADGYRGAPPLGQTSTVDVVIGIYDYQSPADVGYPVDSAELDGVAGIAEGSVVLSITYDPSDPSNPLAYAPSVSAPATFSGAVSGYMCEAQPQGGCLPGTELWSATMSGSGTATITQGSNGMVWGYDFTIAGGPGSFVDPPTPAAEPSTALLVLLGVLLMLTLAAREVRHA